ncbi:MAG: hypothetical protein AB1758_28755, partial [Candidatus Eremiobacterota bacterium]
MDLDLETFRAVSWFVALRTHAPPRLYNRVRHWLLFLIDRLPAPVTEATLQELTGLTRDTLRGHLTALKEQVHIVPRGDGVVAARRLPIDADPVGTLWKLLQELGPSHIRDLYPGYLSLGNRPLALRHVSRLLNLHAINSPRRFSSDAWKSQPKFYRVLQGRYANLTPKDMARFQELLAAGDSRLLAPTFSVYEVLGGEPVAPVDRILHVMKKLGAADSPVTLEQVESEGRGFFTHHTSRTRKWVYGHCVNSPARFRIAGLGPLWEERPLFKRVAPRHYMLLTPEEIGRYRRLLRRNDPRIARPTFNADRVLRSPRSPRQGADPILRALEALPLLADRIPVEEQPFSVTELLERVSKEYPELRTGASPATFNVVFVTYCINVPARLTGLMIQRWR